LWKIETLGVWWGRFRGASPELGEVPGIIRERLFGDERRARRTRRIAVFGGPPAVIAVSLSMWLWLRPMPTPDYDSGRIDELMNFTMLRDEFNRLSVEERLRLLGQLRERLSGLKPSESVLLAAFAGGIMDQAREQLEENASRLAIDMWDQYASEYQYVEPERRGQFLDATVVSFVRSMETLAGQPSDKSDSEILGEARAQAHDDLEELRSDDRGGMNGGAMGMMFSVMRNDVSSHAAPQQRVRGEQMVIDMVRHLRGGG
jgi:hypothetical protein